MFAAMKTKMIAISVGSALLLTISILVASAIGTPESEAEQVTAPTVELKDFTPTPETHTPVQEPVPELATSNPIPAEPEATPEPPIVNDVVAPAPAPITEPEPSAVPTVDPFTEWLNNPTFTCDDGFAPGWLNEQGIPTGCVAN